MPRESAAQARPPKVIDDPLVARDSEGNIAPLCQFVGNFTAFEAAKHFAEMATPEPRKPHWPDGEWDAQGYTGTFRLVGGKRTYLIHCDRVHLSWRVYMLPKGHPLVKK